MNYTRILSIAGSDSGGGAGIQADLKTYSALGAYGMTVITALTAQNTKGVEGILETPVDFVIKQMDAVLTDIGVDAVKIGMLASPAIIAAVAERLSFYNVRTIVLDPVMVATSGHALIHADAVASLKELLIPMASVITPNLPEAAMLTGRALDTEAAIVEGARELLTLGCRAALIKGGHVDRRDSNDFLVERDGREHWLSGRRIETPNTHGTGCTLASAIAVFLARGDSVADACRAAKRYLEGALEAGAAYSLGHGHGPVCHFYQKREP